MRTLFLVPIVVFACFFALADARAQTPPVPDKTTDFTLRILFRLLPLPLVPNSSCARLFPQKNGHPTIGAMLADELATFGGGMNRISAYCDDETPRTCTAAFRHGFNEVDIGFKIIDGKVPSNSLFCSTPR